MYIVYWIVSLLIASCSGFMSWQPPGSQVAAEELPGTGGPPGFLGSVGEAMSFFILSI